MFCNFFIRVDFCTFNKREKPNSNFTLGYFDIKICSPRFLLVVTRLNRNKILFLWFVFHKPSTTLYFHFSLSLVLSPPILEIASLILGNIIFISHNKLHFHFSYLSYSKLQLTFLKYRDVFHIIFSIFNTCIN